MNSDNFSTEVEAAITFGLPAYDAMIFVSFIHRFRPNELDWHGSYYHEWIGRFKNDRFAHMDEHTRIIYDTAETKVSTMVNIL